MSSAKNKKIISFWTTIFLSVVISLQVFTHLPKNILSWDTYGHYLYLPATFVYDDPLIDDFQTIDRLRIQYESAPYFYVGYRTDDNHTMIKYPAGFSVLMSPFFAVGHLYAENSDYPPDGFSQPYQYAIIIGSLCYVLLGFFMLRLVFLKWFSDKLTSLLLFIMVLGTNYYFMVVHSQAMVHGILVLFYAGVILFTYRWHQHKTIKNSILLGGFLGILALTRASDILAVIIPIFWQVSNLKTLRLKFKNLWFNHKAALLTTLAVFALFGFIQLIYWKAASGSFIVDSYKNPGEGFDLLYPHTFNYLFSFRKGWFIYTPIMILSLVGLYISIKNRTVFTTSFLIFTVLSIYLLSSWTNWWYAESFGQRSIIQCYPVFMILIGVVFKATNLSWQRISLASFSAICITLNLFQTWQTNNGLIHLSRMTKDAYMVHLLKTEKHPEYEELLLVNTFAAPQEILNTREFTSESLGVLDFDNKTNVKPEQYVTPGYNSNGCAKITATDPYSNDFVIPYHQLSKNYYAIIKVTAYIKCSESLEMVKPTLACKFRHDTEPYFSTYAEVEHLINETDTNWTKIEKLFITPNIRHPKDDLQVFGWIRGAGSFLIDEIEVTAYNEK